MEWMQGSRVGRHENNKKMPATLFTIGHWLFHFSAVHELFCVCVCVCVCVFLSFLCPHALHVEIPRLGSIGVVATGLHQSHSNVGSEPCL